MTGPRVQKTSGFKPPLVKNPLFRKIVSLNELRAKQKKRYVSKTKNLTDNGRKPIIKKIVRKKVGFMLTSLSKPKFRVMFEEMLFEIEKNPQITVEDLSAKIIRKLETKHPNEYYAKGAIIRLYQEGIKNGVIKIN